MRTNLAVFFGGRSVEHDVSIVTGLQAMENVDASKHNAFAVYLARDGKWYVGDALRDVAFYKHFNPNAGGVRTAMLSGAPGQGLVCREERGGFLKGGGKETVIPVDVALLCMHGVHGEDGCLQGMLEMSDIPYTSAPVGASAVGMDKALMKRVFMGCGFPITEYMDFTRDAYFSHEQCILADIDEKIGYPLYVKPANLGSSIGITCVRDCSNLNDALNLALSYDARIVVERAVPNAVEINCSVLGYGSNCRASLCEKPVGWKDFLTFDDKYLRQGKGKGGQTRVIPAPIPNEMTKRIQSMSCDIFAAMNCKGVVRIDFLVNEQSQKIYVNEINTIPGSLSFYLWEPAGLKYAQLIDELIAIAKRAQVDKKKNSYAYDSGILDKVRRGVGMNGIKGGKHGV